MKRIVDIYEARNFYFSENNEKKLEFLCSDDLCRKEKRPVVIGINYTKLIERDDLICYRPHFREHRNYAHHPLCFELELAEVAKEIEIEDNSNGNLGRKKVSDIVDVFTPFKNLSNSEQTLKPEDEKYAEIRKIRNQADRKKALKDYIKNSRSRSRMLQEVVTCYSILSAKEKTETYLQIGESRQTYQETFQKVEKLDHVQKNIYFGGAKVSYYKVKDKNTVGKYKTIGYMINFFDKLEVNNEVYDIKIFISRFALSRYKYKAHLIKLLEKAASKEIPYLRCFFWGNFQVNHERKSIDIKIEHFNNLHFLLPSETGKKK